MKKVESKKVAEALVKKMIAFEQKLDAKAKKTKAEERHLAFLRSFRRF